MSITLNSDLYAKAKSFDINTSRVAEEALAYVVKQKLTEQIRREVEQDIAYWNRYVEENRAAFDAMDEHFERMRQQDAAPATSTPQPSPASARGLAPKRSRR